MELCLDLLDAYITFLAQVIEDPARCPTAEKIRADVDEGRRVLSRTRVLLDVDGGIRAALTIEPLEAGTWLLNELRLLPDATPAQNDEATALIAEALEQAVPARKIETRVSSKARFDAYDKALRAAGLYAFSP